MPIGNTFSWLTGLSGDWAAASNWDQDAVPDSTAANVTIAATPIATSYTVTIAPADNEIVNAITLGNPGATLEVGGTLTFAGANANMAFLAGVMQIDSTGMVAGAGNIGATQAAGPFVVVNQGTLDANAGAGNLLGVLTGFTNQGTVLASNGSVGIEGPDSVTNLSGTTLTGGTWIVQGPTAGSVNQIIFGFNFTADIAVDAANIVLDGRATDIEGYVSVFQPIEQQLQTIASSGTLQLLDDRGYVTANALTDNGQLLLQGDTLATAGLTIGGTGTLDGFGVVVGGVVNQGAIVADGGALDVTGAVGGIGNLGVASGSTLILNGATAGSLTDKGTVFEQSGLLLIEGALGGTGSLVVQNGGTIEFFSGTAQDITFSGSDATLRLDNFPGYHGTLIGFSHGDTIVLADTAATDAFVSGSSLVVMDNATTVDAIPLAGSYAPTASFSVANVGGNAVISNLSGAPLQQDFQFDITVNDTIGLAGSLDAAIVQDLSAAAEDWAQYLTGHTTLRIQLNIVASGNGSELANAGPTINISNGTTLDGRSLDVPSSLIALTTGSYVQGLTSDIMVNLPTTSLANLFVNPAPTPMPSGTVPSGEFDLVSVFRHELAHGFGFGGLTNANGNLGSQETLFDHYIQKNMDGSAQFIGPDATATAQALFGSPIVQLTTLANGEGYAHFANTRGDPNGTDLMNGIGLLPGTQVDISPMDLAVLADVGAPVTAGLVCYARGTRIATPHGEVPIETLAIGDCVITASGHVAPIIWIGRRRVDCRRHPRPETVLPVCIRAHAFAEGLPRRDLLVSLQHGLHLDGVLIPAKCLINGRTIVQQPLRTIDYFHLELSRHDLLLAEGVPAESYLDCGDRAKFDNGGRVVTLHPDFASRIWDSRGCAELVVAGPVVEAVRHRFAIRARTFREMDGSNDLHGGNGAVGDRATG
jgi:hypothetical protein